MVKFEIIYQLSNFATMDQVETDIDLVQLKNMKTN